MGFMAWLTAAVGHFGIIRLLTGLPKWLHKLGYTVGALVLAVILLVWGLGEANIGLILLAVVAVIAADFWNIADIWKWLFKPEFYRELGRCGQWKHVTEAAETYLI